LIWKILKNIEKLINDEHGNFIIQQILKIKCDQYSKFIFDYTCVNLCQLSKQKYSSNVVDKCILYEDDNYREIIIDKMISAKLIPELIADQFGNYGNFYKK
jgi:pumilio RNA-binding family